MLNKLKLVNLGTFNILILYILSGCLLNLNNGEISFTKNGENLGVAFTLAPERRADCYFPAVVLKNAEMSFNFGKMPFKVKK